MGHSEHLLGLMDHESFYQSLFYTLYRVAKQQNDSWLKPTLACRDFRYTRYAEGKEMQANRA